MFFLYQKFIAARQLQSLNWITQGRIGWNIVTALKSPEKLLSLDTIVTEAMIQPDFNSSYSQIHTKLLRRFICRNQPTIKALLASPEAHWHIIGTVDDMVVKLKIGVLTKFVMVLLHYLVVQSSH